MKLSILGKLAMTWQKTFSILCVAVFMPFGAYAQTVIVETDPCAYLQFEESKDVPSASYVPGIDAAGRPVAPADLAGSHAVEVPETLTFPLSVNLANRLNIALPEGVEMMPSIGEITVDTKSGDAYFNDKEITSGLERVCSDIKLEKSGNILKNNEIIEEDLGNE